MLSFGETKKRGSPVSRISTSVLCKSSLGISDGSGTGEAEPARVLLERLFAQTQKLEQQINNDSRLSEGEGLHLDLEALESDLQAALYALRVKEEALLHAEDVVLQDQSELDKVKQELEQHRRELDSSYARQKELEEELRVANDNLLLEARRIEDLKLLLEARDQEIVETRSTILVKEDELKKLHEEMLKKDEELDRIFAELESRNVLLNEANEVIKSQETKLDELQMLLRNKEHELVVSIQQRQDETQKLKLAEAKLEKQTLEWLSAREQLNNLAREASINMSKTRETMRDFEKLNLLLADVRSELVASQKFLASSRKAKKEQGDQINEQLEEINGLKEALATHTESLRDAQLEIESEQTKLRAEESVRKEVEQKLSAEKELVKKLEEELRKERTSLVDLMKTISVLQKELDKKVLEFSHYQNLLQIKESELVDTRLEIQHLKSEQASFQHILAEKDSSLLTAQNALEEVRHEIESLKGLMMGKENQLVEAAEKLKDKEEYVHRIQNTLDETKMKCDEAASMVEQITQLTRQLVISITDDNTNNFRHTEERFEPSIMSDSDLGLNRDGSQAFRTERQLEMELGMVKDSLRTKESELLSAERELAIKEEERKAILNRLDVKEEEIKRMKQNKEEEVGELKKLYEMTQKEIGNNTLGDLVMEKLQLETAQLEAEAAIIALRNVTDLSHKLLKENFDQSSEMDALLKDIEEMDDSQNANVSFEVAKMEIARLLAVSEQLVRDAHIHSSEDQTGMTGSRHNVGS